MKESILTRHQTKTFIKTIEYAGCTCKMKVTVRYDDSCHNGHNSFSITGEITKGKTMLTCGCLHDDIRTHFPELGHLIRWHLMSSDGPIHYIANTLYFSKTREHQFKPKYTFDTTNTTKWYECVSDSHEEASRSPLTMKKYGVEIKPTPVKWDKPNDAFSLSSARSSAIWADGTLEELQSEKALMDRLPSLIEEFATVVESDLLGFTF